MSQRHNTNHKGTAVDCFACKMEADFDRVRKLERKVFRVAKPIRAPKGWSDTSNSRVSVKLSAT